MEKHNVSFSIVLELMSSFILLPIEISTYTAKHHHVQGSKLQLLIPSVFSEEH